MIIKKDIQDIGIMDLEEWVEKQIPENDRLEFKVGLSEDRHSKETWGPGNLILSEVAKEAILKELVALSNANGGHLIIGVRESEKSPHYACEIVPIPHCEELLSRIMDSLADSVDPMITSIKSKCISVGQPGYGVLIFHTLRSSSAPHRVSTKRCKESYIRIGASSRPMGMAEIQAATLKTNRHIVEGLWTGLLPQPGGPEVGCVFVLEAGKLYGGDSYFYYEGRYEVKEDMSLEAHVKVRHYAGDSVTLFGDRVKVYNVNIGGVIVNDVIVATFTRPDFPGVKPKIQFVRREYLP